MNTAKKVQDVIDIQDQLMVKDFGIEELTASNILLMEKQIREIPEKPKTKEQYQAAYQFNVDAKKLLPRIEERRKELKAPVLEKGKAKAAHAAIVAEREEVWDVAHQENIEWDHAAAVIANERLRAEAQAAKEDFEECHAAALVEHEEYQKAKAERLKLIGPDKLMMQTIADDFDQWVTEKAKVTPAFNTSEATAAFVDLISRIKSAVDCFEKEGLELK